ncbi:hypothetical protein LZ496_00330 [Sphingomonas sp. NSE70-1]|uniref:Uncharacterized protein n=1 Tax=Sphingomonas caseinilyticus TaxID=2908205 RepID=A0ABT0RQY9_9SPHN|nr:hypothetical protein [Sphingomonas caseinilyticus]MCL6697238.1 hypothetical protein [Sphingomonas caseinilyticus]
MKTAQKQHVLETAVEWVAPILLAAALGWAGFRLGAPLAGIVAAAIVAFAGGLGIMRRTDHAAPAAIAPFEAAAIEPVEPDELLLTAEDEVLILDDPLVEPPSDSRVVRLFERQEPTPGELVDRITDFLGGTRQPVLVPQRPVEDQFSADASAALHAALANIKASLR